MSDKSDSSVKLFSYADDQPNEVHGSLIPFKGPKYFKDASAQSESSGRVKLFASSSLVACLLIVFGTSGYGLLAQSTLMAAPIVTIVDPNSRIETTLEYGPQEALSNENLFIETRNAFIDESLTFIEVDINKSQLRYFRNGVLLQSAEILSVPEAGSWWGTPSGLYKVENLSEKTFSNSGQVYLPWLVSFQGNLMIHGHPTRSNDIKVGEDYEGGGVSLSDESAEKLFKNVREGMPVLVHGESEEKVDNFIYEPQVLDISAEQYFIADIENGTILASSEIEVVAPIASLTKLMTAVVVTEEINLDSRIRMASPSFVTSLIPRLADRSTVSVYSLLQLLLVESSNEAAETLAGELGREEFVSAMNTKAKHLGLMNTIFDDSSGLSSENVSSAGDLFSLAKYIYEDKRFIFDITANKKLDNVYVGGEFGNLVNFNEIEGMDSFIGGKVGETEAAGQTSLSLHKIEVQGEERVVAVILLGSEGRTKDIKSLMAFVQNRFED